MTSGHDPPEPAELVTRAARGDAAAWEPIIEELGPLVRGYLRAVGDPDPDEELANVFDQMATEIGVYAGDVDEFVMFLFDITVARQRTIRRSLPEAPAATPYARPGWGLDPDVRDAVLLDRLARLDTDQIAYILATRPDQVQAWQGQGSAQIADEEWGTT